MKFYSLAGSMLLLIIAVFVVQSCKNAQTVDNGTAAAVEIPKTDPPFASQEPEKYETEIWQKSQTGTDKFFVARDGDKWRIDSATGTPDQVTTIHTDKEYVYSYATKIYTEMPIGHGFDERADTLKDMTFGMLNATEKAAYEKAGTENGLTKYRIAPDPGKNTESLVYFDEKIGLPVKKEVFKTDGGQKVFDHSVELVNFKAAVDQTQFTPLKGFKQVAMEDIKKALMGSK